MLDELAAAGARAIAYDRRGYGASGAPEPYAATTVQEQAEDAAALLAALGAAPAVLVGDGFGALVVLDLLVRRPELARAAVLVDPPLHAFVPAATEALAAERVLLEEALREGGPGARGARLARRRGRRRRGARRAGGRRAARVLRRLRRASRAGRRRGASCARSPCRWRPARAAAIVGGCGRGGGRRGATATSLPPPRALDGGAARRGGRRWLLSGERCVPSHACQRGPRRPGVAARRATTATVPPRRASAKASSAATATGASGSAAAVMSASRLRRGALCLSAW